MNPLAKGIRDYLALRRGLGFKLARQGWAKGVRVFPGTETQFSHHRCLGIGVGDPACPPAAG